MLRFLRVEDFLGELDARVKWGVLGKEQEHIR